MNGVNRKNANMGANNVSAPPPNGGVNNAANGGVKNTNVNMGGVNNRSFFDKHKQKVIIGVIVLIVCAILGYVGYMGYTWYTKKEQETVEMKKAINDARKETKDVANKAEQDKKDVIGQIDKQVNKEVSKQVDKTMDKKLDKKLDNTLDKKLDNTLDKKLDNTLDKKLDEKNVIKFPKATSESASQPTTDTISKEPSAQLCTSTPYAPYP